MQVLREININLNTRHRDEGSVLSLPTWTLSIPITLKHRQSSFEFMVRSISLPKAFFYSFVDQTASWQRTVGGVPTGVPIVYNLATGNHTIAELQVFMRTWEPYTGSSSVTLSGPTNALSLQGITTTFPGLGNGILTLTQTLADALSLPTTYVVIPNVRRTSDRPVDNVLSRSLFVLCHMSTTDCFSSILKPYRESRVICRIPMLNLAAIANAFDYDFPLPYSSTIVDQTISQIQLSLATEQFAQLNVLLDYTITISIMEVLYPFDDKEMLNAASLKMSDLHLGSSTSDAVMESVDESVLRDAARLVKAKRIEKKSDKNSES